MKKTTRLIFTAVFFVATAITLTACGGESFTDPRDGQTYKMVKIGEQTWMAENLKYKGGAYEIDESGAKYEWDSALVACPNGWHLPNKSEMKSVLTDTSFQQLWTSTEKEDLTLTAFQKRFNSIDIVEKTSVVNVRCIQGQGTSISKLDDINGIKTVRIGNQIWMANNLNIETPNSICYLEDAEECAKGRFYSISEAQNICPKGWRLPNKKDASLLINKLSKSGNEIDYMRGRDFVRLLTGSFGGPKMGYYENSEFKNGLGSMKIGYWLLSDDGLVRNHVNDLEVEGLYSSMKQAKFNVRCIADSENKE